MNKVLQAYNNLVTKRQLVLRKLELLDVDILILQDLKNSGIDINNEKVSYIVKMIKQIIFEYAMYGILDTNIVLKDNINYLLGYLLDENTPSLDEVKKTINPYLKKLNFPFNNVENILFEKFLISSATRIKSQIEVKKSKEYKYSINKMR